MSRIWKILVVAVICILVGIFLISQKVVISKSASSVDTYIVKRQTFTKTISSSGKTKAKIEADIKFQTSGTLVWVGVKEGDWVKKGQVIARLDSRDVQKSLEKSLKDYALERNDFEETWRVTYKGIDKPTNALNDTMKRILEKNQWDLDKTVLDVELKHLSLEYARVVSPIAGIVTHVDTPIAGINITPATAVFTVVDPSNIVFEANIDEVDVGKLSEGQKAVVSLDAYPDASFDGVINRISFAAKTSAGGATVFPVEILMASVSAIRVGYNGDVQVNTMTISDSILIPLVALREDETTKYVYKKIGKTFKKVTVTASVSNEDSVVILSGISEGDVIVTKGFSTLPK